MREPSVRKVIPNRTTIHSAKPVNGNCPETPMRWKGRFEPSGRRNGESAPTVARRPVVGVAGAFDVERDVDGVAATDAAEARGDAVGALTPRSVGISAGARTPSAASHLLRD